MDSEPTAVSEELIDIARRVPHIRIVQLEMAGIISKLDPRLQNYLRIITSSS